MLAFVPKRSIRVIPIVGAIFAISSAYALAGWASTGFSDSDGFHLVYQNTLSQSLGIWLGCLLAMHEGKIASASVRLIVCGLLLVVGCGLPLLALRLFPVPFQGVADVLIFNALLAAAGVAFSLNCPSRPWLWLVRHPWLRWTGRISYGVYVFHFPIFWRLGLLKWSYMESASTTIWTAPAGLFLTFVVATVSYYFFERPIMRLGAAAPRPLHLPQPALVLEFPEPQRYRPLRRPAHATREPIRTLDLMLEPADG